MTTGKSLNFPEIDLILQELDLPGYRIQEIAQPTPKELILDLYKNGEKNRLYFGFASNICRFHFFHGRLPKNKIPQRFVSFLRAHIRNAYIVSAEHVMQDRIILLKIKRGEINLDFWIRMWTNAPNIIVTNSQHIILDAMFRRPKQKEISGERFNPAETLEPKDKNTALFTIRKLPGEGSFQERLERFFSESKTEDESVLLKERINKVLISREGRLLNTKKRIAQNLEKTEGFDRFREIADLVKSNLSDIKQGDRWLACEDFYHDSRKTEIELDPKKNGIENAEEYYAQYKKAKTQHQHLLDEKAINEKELVSNSLLLEELAHIEDISRLRVLNEQLSKSVQNKHQDESAFPGRRYNSHGFTLIVGKTAKENEQLLRKHVRGNDYWLHTRDTAGAYVFIKSKPGKSVPLDVLLDAGNLAVFFSKARTSGKADLYYTQVKYLKKVKGAKPGLVLATQEKNMTVTVEEHRIQNLLKDTETVAF